MVWVRIFKLALVAGHDKQMTYMGFYVKGQDKVNVTCSWKIENDCLSLSVK